MLRVSEKNSSDRTHGFETPSRGACRHLFRCCIDHQAFFRLMATGPPPMSPYSRFRSYSPPLTGTNTLGLTEKQQVGMIWNLKNYEKIQEYEEASRYGVVYGSKSIFNSFYF